MSGKSANNQPATYQAQAGGCVNISRPDKCYKSQRTCGIHIAVNVLSSRPSARIALLELKHAEERALQQRKFEAERRALEQEKKLIQKKYNLLEQQSSVRRSTKRSLRAVHIADEVKQNAQHSVSDDNEILFDEQQSNHNIQPPILLDQLPKQTQLCEIQHRNTDSLPKTIPNGQETSDDSGLLTKGNITICLSSEVPSSESGNEINRDVLVESISGSPCFRCSLLDFENNLTTLRFMSSTVCFSSIVTKGEIYLDQNASGTLYKLQVQLYVPPRLVSPAVPNPDPPPSDQEVRRTETFRVDPAAIIISVFGSLIRCSSISSNMFSEASSEMFSTERNTFCYRFSKQPFKELKNQISKYVDLSRLMLRVKRCSSAHCDGIIDRRSIRLLWDTVNRSLESNRAQIHLITKQFSSVSTISVQKSASRFHNLPQHDCSDQQVSLTTITKKKSHDRGCC
ncbi:AAEL012406-PA, partial [Aedes aegypti]